MSIRYGTVQPAGGRRARIVMHRRSVQRTPASAAVRAYPSGRASGNAARCQARVGAVSAETRYASAWAVSREETIFLMSGNGGKDPECALEVPCRWAAAGEWTASSHQATQLGSFPPRAHAAARLLNGPA